MFYVNNNRKRDSLFPIIKNNVYTYYRYIQNNRDSNDNIYPARIFPDCFQAYHVQDFNN